VLRTFSGDPAAAVRAHSERLVLVIPAGVTARACGRRAGCLRLTPTSSDTSTGTDHNRLAALLHAYAGQLASLRLQGARHLTSAVSGGRSRR